MKKASILTLAGFLLVALSIMAGAVNYAPEAIWNKIFDTTNNAIQVSIVSAGNSAVTGTLDVAGNTTLGGTLDVTGQTTVGDAQVDGWAIYAPVIVAASSYTISSADKAMNYIVNYSDTGAGSIFLPASAANGTTICIADGDLHAGTNNITIRRQGSDTINEGTTYALNADGESICSVYESSATDWHIITGYAE